MADMNTQDQNQPETHDVLVGYGSQTHTFQLSQTATLSDLQSQIFDTFSVAPEHQKLMAPKLGLLRDPSLAITSIPSPPKKILLMGSSTTVVSNAQAANAPDAASQRKFGGTGPIKAARPTHRVDWTKASESAIYTFTEINVLRHLPNSDRSVTYLKRLRDDPGIRAVMRKHKWTVPLLSELDPAEHTTMESRTLGLNKNNGQEILLRLRTDAYDGYRDYNTVRKTLCHELAHNVHSEHERPFWDLFKIIVKEVEQADWAHGGKTVSGGGDGGRMRWEGDAEERKTVESEDGGGWQGGSFVLGGSETASSSSGNRREMAAKAAEERLKALRGGPSEQNQK